MIDLKDSALMACLNFVLLCQDLISNHRNTKMSSAVRDFVHLQRFINLEMSITTDIDLLLDCCCELSGILLCASTTTPQPNPLQALRNHGRQGVGHLRGSRWSKYPHAPPEIQLKTLDCTLSVEY